MFTGIQPFHGDNAVALALKHIREVPRSPREIDSSITPVLERAILKCLEKDPDKRFQSIAELEPELRATAGVNRSAETDGQVGTRAIPKTQVTVATEAAAGSPKSGRWVAIGSLIIVGSVAIGVWMARHRTSNVSLGMSSKNEHRDTFPGRIRFYDSRCGSNRHGKHRESR